MPSAGNAPFWALSSLGGDRSVIDEREPLRGYGADRFIDRNMFATGLELRTSVVNLNAFGTHVSVEAAPFLDAGKVFAALGGSPFSRLHATPGLAYAAWRIPSSSATWISAWPAAGSRCSAASTIRSERPARQGAARRICPLQRVARRIATGAGVVQW